MTTAGKVSSSAAVATAARPALDDWRPWNRHVDSASSVVGPSDPWQRPWDQGGQQGGGFGGYSQDRSRQEQKLPYTPFVGMMASAYPVTDMTWDGLLNTPLFLSDVSHGIGVYEYNMRLTVGTYAAQGSVINRYS